MPVSHTEVILRHGNAELARVALPPGEYVIGRSPEAEIFVDTPLLSRRHARLTIADGDRLQLEDLGSSNGTFVGDQRITDSIVLPAGQPVRLGDVSLEYRPGPGNGSSRELPDELLASRAYVVGDQIARGGMGAILAAEQTALKRPVAMKVMLKEGNAVAVRRFIEEAQVTGQLTHPNIVPIHELGVDDRGQVFYTMKMVQGITLKKVIERLRQGVEGAADTYSLGNLLTIFQKTCDAVAFAHSHQVIHRDLKPENIMLGDFGEVLVMDWGLAKRVAAGHPAVVDDGVPGSSAPEGVASGSTLEGTILGTPAYMAPEQARGEIEELDARSDIYSLGAILFELLHFRPTVTGHSAAEVIDKVGRGEIEAPESESVPQSLAAVVRKAMAPLKTDRYASVEDLQRDLTAYQNGFATSAEGASFGKQILLALKRHRIAVAGLVAVLLVGAVFGTRALIEGRRAEREAVRANQALADLKKSAPALLQLAASEAAVQRFESALGNADAALLVDPTLGEARWRRGWILLGQQKLPQAIAALREANATAPNPRFAALLPMLEKLAAAPEAERMKPELLSPIVAHLSNVGALGEATPYLLRLKLDSAGRLRLARERIEQWLGKGAIVTSTTRGVVTVTLTGLRVGSLGPIRGLPIDQLMMRNCGVEDLEPLRGIPLRMLWVDGNPVGDLGPLAGMPLENLMMEGTKVTDISALRGMPLRVVHLGHGPRIADLSPLAGAPLEELFANNSPTTDFSFLRGMPLRKLQLGNTSFRDCSILQGIPLEELVIPDGVENLAALIGTPLKWLVIANKAGRPISLEPLMRVPTLEQLVTSVPMESLLPLRHHPGLKLINYRDAGLRPAAEFWAEYETQKGKK